MERRCPRCQRSHLVRDRRDRRRSTRNPRRRATTQRNRDTNDEHSAGNVDDDAGGVRCRWVRLGGPTTMSTPNGQRSRATAVIADNPSDLLESPRLPGKTSPGGPAGNDGDAEKPAPTPDAPTPSVPARTPGSTDSRSSDVIGSDGHGDAGVGEGAERAVL